MNLKKEAVFFTICYQIIVRVSIDMTRSMFKMLVNIEVERSFQLQSRGRPRLLAFDEAYDSMLKVLRTCMQ